MYATEIVMPSEIFNFSGQSKIDTFSLDQLIPELVGYDEIMMNFTTHWPNRYSSMYGKRNHAETAFSMITRLFGQRLRCRSRRGRKNELQAKLSMFNIFLLAKMSANSLG